MHDFLIVGQGLAGSVLALQLLQHGQQVLVINNRTTNQASCVAAGLYNPITGSKLVKTWLADDLFPYLHTFYRAAERTLGTTFLYAKPIFRPFLTAEERTEWLHKVHQAAYTAYVQAIADENYQRAYMRHHHGGLVLQQAGYVDVPSFLAATRTYLQTRGAYLEADFVHEAVQLTDGVQYQQYKARRLIFCEGPQVRQNPFFNILPLRPVKGEWRTVSLQQPLDVSYNRGVFVLPRSPRCAMVGATYDRHHLDLLPTATACETLERRLQQMFALSYSVLNQKVGLRPATADHRPLIGLHPHYPQLGIFNGLGSKGVSMAPYFAAAFMAHLLHQKPLPQAVALTRIKQWP